MNTQQQQWETPLQNEFKNPAMFEFVSCDVYKVTDSG